MGTTFPSTVQTFSDPLATDALSGHASLHVDMNDTVEAIQNKLGVDGDSDVTTVDNRLAVLESEITPSGAISMFAGGAAPSGWFLCNGAAVSRTTYADLFAVVGSTYGAGDGSTTFNVPDFRDRVPVGAGSSYSLNQAIGALTDSITLSSANLPTHVHSIEHNHGSQYTGYDGEHNHGGQVFVAQNAGQVTLGLGFQTGSASINTEAAHRHAVDIDNFTGNSSNGGFANTAITVDIVQPSRGINFIIKA